MPQLDKVSFATQYLWLTFFFFALYFLTTNFFVILVFKNLRLRNMIYSIWYFLIYRFDYQAYQYYNASLFNNSFNLVYTYVHLSLLTLLKPLLFTLSFAQSCSSFMSINLLIQNKQPALISKVHDLEYIIIDEI